jgi:hypothetical protein
MVVLFNERDMSKQNQVQNKTRNYIAESGAWNEKPGAIDELSVFMVRMKNQNNAKIAVAGDLQKY